MEVGAGLFALVMMLFMGLAVVTAVVLGVGGTVLWLWMLIDCVTKEPDRGSDKIAWILIIVFTGWIGALVYWIVRRPQRITQYGR